MPHMRVEKDDVVLVRVYVLPEARFESTSVGYLPCLVLEAFTDSYLVQSLTQPEARPMGIRSNQIEPW